MAYAERQCLRIRKSRGPVSAKVQAVQAQLLWLAQAGRSSSNEPTVKRERQHLARSTAESGSADSDSAPFQCHIRFVTPCQPPPHPILVIFGRYILYFFLSRKASTTLDFYGSCALPESCVLVKFAELPRILVSWRILGLEAVPF